MEEKAKKYLSNHLVYDEYYFDLMDMGFENVEYDIEVLGHFFVFLSTNIPNLSVNRALLLTSIIDNTSILKFHLPVSKLSVTFDYFDAKINGTIEDMVDDLLSKHIEIVNTGEKIIKPIVELDIEYFSEVETELMDDIVLRYEDMSDTLLFIEAKKIDDMAKEFIRNYI